MGGKVGLRFDFPVGRKCGTEIRVRIGLAKEAFQKLGDLLGNKNISLETKKKGAGLLCDILPLIWQCMQGNLPTDEKKTRGTRNMFLQKDNENSIDGYQ